MLGRLVQMQDIGLNKDKRDEMDGWMRVECGMLTLTRGRGTVNFGFGVLETNQRGRKGTDTGRQIDEWNVND